MKLFKPIKKENNFSKKVDIPLLVIDSQVSLWRNESIAGNLNNSTFDKRNIKSYNNTNYC